MARRSNRPRGVVVRTTLPSPVLPTVGRDLRFASRSPLLLPRHRTVVPTGKEKFDSLLSDISRFRSRLRFQPPNLTPPRRIAIRSKQLRSLVRPFLSDMKSPCVRRRERSQVMFALKVAGRRWGSGGPRMDRARRSVFSSYSCVR